MESSSELSIRVQNVRRILVTRWPVAEPLLRYENCFELLVAVVLSAQTTDNQVNGVTPALFGKWPTPADLAAASTEDVEQCIHSVGFFHTKAKHLVRLAKILAERYDGNVPQTMEELLELPGVGRKTANLVASACFGRPGIIADTHFLRVCHRLGFVENRDPLAAERRIEILIAPEHRTAFSHAVNRHGKFICTARSPDCPACPVRQFCPSAREHETTNSSTRRK